MKFIGGGLVGGMLGVGGNLKAGNTIHKEANSSAVSSVGHRNCYSQPGKIMQTVVCSRRPKQPYQCQSVAPWTL